MRSRIHPIPLLLCLLAALGMAPRETRAHGLHGHIHVTGWAIENLPPGELASIFDDPDVFQAALAGAMLPDTGYAADRPAAREYAEYSHWEPFIERFIQHVIAAYGPTYDTKEEKMLIAFLLGAASHGLQDELFDSTFLFEVEERDGRGQEVTDPGTDGFLVLDGYFRLLPNDYIPYDELVPLYDGLGVSIDRALIEEHVNIVRGAYVNDGFGLQYARGYGMRIRPQIPWASDNYITMGIPGSLASEIEPTMRHMEALWERLHGRFDESELVVYAWPEAPRRLRSWNHESVASWVTLVLGKGVRGNSMTAALLDDFGAGHPFQLRSTRWGGWSGMTRVVRFLPTADYNPGAGYSAHLEAGAELVDGSLTTTAHEHHFVVECSPEQELCEPIEVTDDPVIVLPVTPTPSPTSLPTPTPTQSLFAIDGCVVHFSGCGGSQEFGVVTMQPGGRTATVDMGFFRFEDVPPGEYTLRYLPACNPAGCTGPVMVTITDRDGYAGFYRSTCAGDCNVDFEVTIDEVLQCVTMALGGPYACAMCNLDGTFPVTVNDLIRVINAVLNGCR